MADYAAPAPTEPEPEAQSPPEMARRWIAEIEAAEKVEGRETWLTRAKAILELYAEKKRSGAESASRRFALFWSNIEVLKPAVLARVPTAVVTRRFKDADPVGRLASEVLERALNFSIDAYDFEGVLKDIRDEYLLLARGVAWVRYIPTIRTVDGAQASAEVADDAEPYETVAWEEAKADYVHYKDFLYGAARKWSEVPWVARRAFLTRKELIDRFPECGPDVPLDFAPQDKANAPESQKKAAVYEIWDKTAKQAIWVAKGYTDKPLDVRDDPLKLKGFFPCPKPALGTVTPDSLIPTPDYIYYQDQAREIDKLTGRIDVLLDALKVRGFYAGSKESDLNTLLSSSNSTLIPVESWAMLKDGGGLKGLIEWFPLDQIVSTLKECFEARRQLIDDVYQVTGISDIQRGDTDPGETLGAQQLKAGFGSARARERKAEMARMARDILQLMGEVIATRFSPETLAQMTGVQLLTAREKAQLQQQAQAAQAAQQQQAMQAQAMGQPPPPPAAPPILPQQLQLLAQPSWEDVMGVLRNPALRMFRIDIETDSTVEPNDQEEKQRRIEFIAAIGKYLADSLPVVQAQPAILPVIVQGLLWLVRGFRVGREMEDVIERAMDQLGQAAQAPQAQPQGPDPQAERLKAEAAQTNAQANMAKAQVAAGQLQIEQGKLASQHQIGMAQVAAENQRTAVDAHLTQHELMIQAVDKAEQRRLMGEINSRDPIKAPTP